MDQWGTLLGVLVGAVASYAVTALTERARWRRAQAERWQEKKFDVYARYSNALKEQIGITQRIGAALGYAHVVDPLEPAEGLPLLAEAEARRATLWESVLLVGDAETVTAARSWHEAVWTLELHVPYRQMLVASGVAMAVCLIAALSPARRIARLEPASALRYE